MATIFLCLFRFLHLLGSGHQAVALENLVLRRQLAALRRKRRRPILTEWDRLFWIGLARVWAGSKGALVVVQPDTYYAGNEISFAVTGPHCPDRKVGYGGGRRWPTGYVS